MSSAVWIDEFFGEHSIVNTLQILLMNTNRSLEDLCSLCVIAHKSKIVVAFTSEGLMPFTNNTYVYPYALMSRRQLAALIAYCQRQKTYAETHMLCVYSNDMYLAKMHGDPCALDDTMLLFAAATILVLGLHQSMSTRRGHAFWRLDKGALDYHVDVTLFKVVHSCSIRPDALVAAKKLLLKHNVR